MSYIEFYNKAYEELEKATEAYSNSLDNIRNINGWTDTTVFTEHARTHKEFQIAHKNFYGFLDSIDLKTVIITDEYVSN